MKIIKSVLLLLITTTLFIGCYDDRDDVINDAGNLEIENFIYRGMNAFYLYKADVPELANNAFETQTELDAYLASFSEPEDLFYNGLLSDVDRFSFLVDDYIALEMEFSGITLNNGMDFGLVRYPNDPSNVFGFVRYIVPNSPAADTNLKRGDIFNRIDGTQVTDENFRQLLQPETYTIGLADFDGQTVTPNSETVELTKIELTENPVHIAKTIDVNNTTVGYLMYNAFIGDFDSQLNAAFGDFAAQGINELVLDLRYNSGGSVKSAIDLSSMITGQFTGEIITTEQWNDEIQAQFEANDPERLVNRFSTSLRTSEAINSLELNRVYILTTPRTASASELVINGLLPYIDVVQIGTNTTGKFQASITLYDSQNFTRPNANPNHTYAIQPLVLKEINANGNTDFFDGLPPDIRLEEDYSNLGVLGDPNEPLLSAALNNISGFAPDTTQRSKASYGLEIVGERGMHSPLHQEMYIDFKN